MQLQFIFETEKIPVDSRKLLVYLLNVAMGRVSRGRIEDVEKDGKKERDTAVKVCLEVKDMAIEEGHYIVKGNMKCIIESTSPIYIMELMYGLQSIRLFTHRQYQIIPKEIFVTEDVENERVQCFVHHA